MAKMSKPQLLKRAAGLGLAVDAAMTNKALGAAIRKAEQDRAKVKVADPTKDEEVEPSPTHVEAQATDSGSFTVVVTDPDPSIPDVLSEAVEFAAPVIRKPRFVRLPRRGQVTLD